MHNDDPELLTQTLQFTVINPRSENNIFRFVIDGRLTSLAQMVNSYPAKEQSGIVNTKDPDGKTPIFYACYYNFQNIVMFLMMKGADPFLPNNKGMTPIHVCAYRGHIECSYIIYNFIRHQHNINLLEQLKVQMKSYSFKKSDVTQGVLITSDKHVKAVQQRFAQFQIDVSDLFQSFLDHLLHDYQRALTINDQLQRNPIHYSALSKYTKSLKTSKFLVLYSTKLEGWDFFLTMFNEVQLLELQKDKKIDPRQYHPAMSITQNFLEKHVEQKQVYKFMKEIKRLEKEIVNSKDNDGYTPMHIASFAGDFAAIQFFLSVGGDPKIKCRKHGKDVLEYASNDMVRKYLVDLKNAAKDGDEKSYNLLVNCGHPVDGKSTIYGVAALHNAITFTHKSKQQNMLNTVISSDADINISDSNGWTALHHACSLGEIDSVRTLFERGAQVNRFSNKGYYPIHIAALHNHAPVIDLLMENGANVDSQSDSKCTPLHLAAKKGFSTVIETLHNHNTNIYAVDDRSWTALHYAAFYEHKAVVHQLCRFDGDHQQLWQMRTSRGKLARDLITNPEIKFAFQTLWRASMEGNLDVVRRLVIMEHDVNEQTAELKQTPLILATLNNHFLIAKFLLDNGADRSIKDKNGKTALDYTREMQNYKLYRLLDEDTAQ